jgi:hypothetical protein
MAASTLSTTPIKLRFFFLYVFLIPFEVSLKEVLFDVLTPFSPLLDNPLSTRLPLFSLAFFQDTTIVDGHTLCCFQRVFVYGTLFPLKLLM